MKYVLFRNPKIIYREEEYGGLVSSGLELYIIEKKDYNFLKKLDKEKFILEKDLSEEEIILSKKFIQKGVVIKVDYERIKNKIGKTI